jgi:hypothetical protein
MEDMSCNFRRLEDSFMQINVESIAETLIVLDKNKAIQVAEMILALTMLEEIAEKEREPRDELF